MSPSSVDPRPTLDVDRLIGTLARHGVDYLLVGGVATQLYGATRPTMDLDCLIRQTRENLTRLTAAMRELRARLRVEGMTDADAAALPMQLHAEAILRLEISTWRTDAGDFDVLIDLPGADGRRRRYEEIVGRAAELTRAGVVDRVASLEDIVASKRWANRAKDREALPELEAIIERRRGAFDDEDRPS